VSASFYDAWDSKNTPTAPTTSPRPLTPVRAGASPYGQAALAAETEAVANAPEGTRNDTLNRAAFSLGQLIAAGHLDEREALEALSLAGHVAGLGAIECDKTIHSGFTAGKKDPRQVPDLEAADAYVQALPVAAAALTLTTPTADNGGGHGDRSTADADDDGEPSPVATWARVDLTAHLDGTYTAPTTQLMPRTDGVCLLYAGLTHSLHGESESGKSWVAQAEAARCLQEGQEVLYVDFESDAASIVERMLLLGVSKADIAQHLDYRSPEASPTAAHEIDAWRDMLSCTCVLAVIDGVTDAMGLFGAKTADNDEISRFMRVFPKQLARRTGAAVVMIDHVTKNAETRGRFAIGGQSKMASLTGAGYVVDVVQGLGKGLRGILTLRVAKDRPGSVRGKSGFMRKTDRTQESARFILDSTGPQLIASLEPWAGADGSEKPAFRPTHLMERASRFIEDSPGVGKNAIERGVTGNNDALRVAIDVLVEEGYVRREASGQSLRHYPVKPFREFVEDQLEDL
jgi:AAA domain-containing protein